MAVTGKLGVGIPALLLHEGEGHIVTVETNDGDIYIGTLIRAEDNMNLKLRNVTHKFRKGDKIEIDMMNEVFIRGSQISLVLLPEILEEAPVFNRVRKHKKAKGKYTPQGSGTARATRVRNGQIHHSHAR